MSGRHSRAKIGGRQRGYSEVERRRPWIALDVVVAIRIHYMQGLMKLSRPQSIALWWLSHIVNVNKAIPCSDGRPGGRTALQSD
jgi:hypothetical protein